MQRLLDDIRVDVRAHLHAGLEVGLVVALRSLGLDVLLDGVDLRFIPDQTLLDLVEPVVNVRLEDLVLPGVVPHAVVSGLLLQLALVLLNQVLDQVESPLFLFEVAAEVGDLVELVEHLVLHLVDALGDSLHLLVNPLLQVPNLVQISGPRLNLNLKLRRCHLRVIQLPLLKVKIFLHLLDRVLVRQFVLSRKVFLHVLEQSLDHFLVLLDFFLVLGLLRLKLRTEFLDFLFLRSQDLELASILVFLRLARQFVLDFFNVLLVRLDDLAHLLDFFLLLLDLCVVLLYSVHQSLPCLWERQVHFIRLQLKVVFPFQQVALLVSKVLRTLLQSVLSEPRLRLPEPLVDLLEFPPLLLNFGEQLVVIVFVLLVVVPLFGVEVVEFGLVGEVDLLDLLFVRVDFVLHVSLLREEAVQVGALLVVLVFDVHEERLDVLGLRV